jgi:hypothetical protein
VPPTNSVVSFLHPDSNSATMSTVTIPEIIPVYFIIETVLGLEQPA